MENENFCSISNNNDENNSIRINMNSNYEKNKYDETNSPCNENGYTIDDYNDYLLKQLMDDDIFEDITEESKYLAIN